MHPGAETPDAFPPMSHQDSLRFLYSLEGLGVKLGLERMEALMALLGNPERSYPSVLVAGTNGKGSASAMLASILSEAGLRAGLYTSPHLERINERIRVDGRGVSDGDLDALVALVRGAAERGGAGHPTFFEFVTAMAFCHFRDAGVEVAVLEVGMGGRLDATNVAAPLVSVITGVGLDHTGPLGGTPGEIAREKAGIIREGGRVVSAVEDGGALAVVEEVALRMGAELSSLGRDFRITPGAAAFDYRGAGVMKGLEAGLAGAHQQKNAACAAAAAEALATLGYPVDEGAIRRGLAGVRWPGRFEVVRESPLVVLDCAHNPDGARALAETFRGLSCARLILVLGMMADKDIDAVMAGLLPLAHTVVLTVPARARSAPLEVLEEKARIYPCTVVSRKTVGEAVDEALATAAPDDCVCIAGSVFTVGEARTHLVTPAPK